MKMKTILWLVALLLGLTTNLLAAENQHQLGIGFQGSMPNVGLSVKYNPQPELGLQGTFGVFNTLTTGGIRAQFQIPRGSITPAFYLAFAGFDNSDRNYDGTSQSYNALGTGFAVEWEFKKIPDFSFGVDVGFVRFLHYDRSVRDYTTMTAGVGIHYYLK